MTDIERLRVITEMNTNRTEDPRRTCNHIPRMIENILEKEKIREEERICRRNLNKKRKGRKKHKMTYTVVMA